MLATDGPPLPDVSGGPRLQQFGADVAHVYVE